MSNRLANETSPYLLQHAENPVNWYPWDKTINEYGDVAYFLRLEDKLNRLKNLTKKEAKVKDEAIEDTLKDIVGYTLLMLNYKKGRE